jgi:ADP-ribosylglycohydrolase
VKDAATLTRGLVVGLLQPEVLTRLPHDAAVVTVLTHKDPLCAAATSAYARAVSLALEEHRRSPAAFCEALAVAAGQHDGGLAEELRSLPRILAWEKDRAFALLRRVGVPPKEAKEDGLPAHPVPVLLTAVYAVLKHEGDFRDTLASVLRLGGEVDVCGALIGGLLGAHLGCSALPARLRAHVLYGAEIAETADRLCAVRAASVVRNWLRARDGR